MYKDNISNKDFLFNIYLKIKILLKENLKILSKENKSLKEINKLSNNNKKIINVIDYLLNISENEALKNSFLNFEKLIIFNSINDQKKALNQINSLLKE